MENRITRDTQGSFVLSPAEIRSILCDWAEANDKNLSNEVKINKMKEFFFNIKNLDLESKTRLLEIVRIYFPYGCVSSSELQSSQTETAIYLFTYYNPKFSGTFLRDRLMGEEIPADQDFYAQRICKGILDTSLTKKIKSTWENLLKSCYLLQERKGSVPDTSNSPLTMWGPSKLNHSISKLEEENKEKNDAVQIASLETKYIRKQ